MNNAEPPRSSVSALQLIDGVPVLNVRHDDTCPLLRKKETHHER